MDTFYPILEIAINDMLYAKVGFELSSHTVLIETGYTNNKYVSYTRSIHANAYECIIELFSKESHVYIFDHAVFMCEQDEDVCEIIEEHNKYGNYHISEYLNKNTWLSLMNKPFQLFCVKQVCNNTECNECQLFAYEPLVYHDDENYIPAYNINAPYLGRIVPRSQ